ncbi:uncharacterized protein LOC126777435 [Nymphalis io]|uniref:uncharacterized protein LOC126777435 n=1 Tax=Inachis io TaxID=171585 RepID=UPI002168FC65|nr:uncharacterized protein LOC126777435 [Nymphalis io]
MFGIDNIILGSDEDEESLSRELLKKLTPAVLSKLRRSFKKAKERNTARDIERRVEEVMRAAAAEEGIEFATPATRQPNTLYLDEKSFVAALENIFGHHKYTTHAHQFFQTLDAFGSGRVWWKQVVAKLVAAGARSTTSRCERWSPVMVGGMLKLEHCKRETIIKLVNIERENSFCYAAVSRGGRVGVYSGDMQLLSSYEELFGAPHTSYCNITSWRKVHSRSVRRVSHARDGDYVLSCSHDTSVSVRLRHALGKLEDYVFNVQRGVSCFHMVPSLHMLVTGSPDGIVRLWESPQSSPFASLSVPGSPAILDVAVVVALEIIVAYCTPLVPVTSKPAPPSPKLLKPVAIEHPTYDLDELLEKAGLQGILEKDFVLMQGLKHDLNKKLYEMEANKEAIRSAVTAGAPYLALKNYEPEPLPTFQDLAEQCSRVMRLLPGSSVIASPSGSEYSSPRNSKSFKLYKSG